MENGNFNYGNLHFQNHQPELFQQTFPSINNESFVVEQNNPFPPQQQFFNNVFQNNETLDHVNYGYGFGYGDHVFPCSGQENIQFSQGIYSSVDTPNHVFPCSGQENIQFSQGIYPSDTPNSHDQVTNIDEISQNTKGKGKRVKASYVHMIKGQWSEEEDRRLTMLVTHFGDHKWATVAENMCGRLGKQCRERWHNHLRPDIKKDAWSEEEERLLIQAHKRIDNKWAEIANYIPGRSENSVKNHWNATKRKLGTKRMNKKQNGIPQSTLLLDYIRSYYSSNSTNVITNTVGGSVANIDHVVKNTTIPSPDEIVPTNLFFANSIHDDYDDSPPLSTHQIYEDEVNFMQNLFGNNLDGSFVDVTGKASVYELGVNTSTDYNGFTYTRNGNQIPPAGNGVESIVQEDASNVELYLDNCLANYNDNSDMNDINQDPSRPVSRSQFFNY